MTTVAPAMIATADDRVTARLGRALPIVTLLQIQIVLWTVLPSKLILGPLGAIGAPNRILGLLLLGVWGICVLTPSLGVFRRCLPVRVVLLLFWMAAVLSWLVMNFHYMEGDLQSGANIWLLSVASISGVALTAAEGLRSRDEVKRLVRTAVYGISFMGLAGILQARAAFDVATYFAKIPLLTPQGEYVQIQARDSFTRPSGTAIHPIEFGVVVGLGLALAIWMAMYDHETPRWRRYGAVFVIALAVPTSISRSALLVALVVLLFVFTGATPALRVKAFGAFVGITALVFVTVPGLLGTLGSYVTMGKDDSSIAERTSDYTIVARYARHSPWVGRGPGTFFPPRFEVLDNQYLGTLVEMGIIGLITLMVLFLTPAVLGRGARRRDRAEDDRFLGQMLASTGVASFVTAATFDALAYPSFAFMVALMLGLSGAWWGFARADAGELDDPNRGRILGGRLHRPWEQATVERRPPFARLRSSVRPRSASGRIGSMDVNRR